MNWSRLKASVLALFHDGWKFGVIGAGGYIVDVFIFNAILWGNGDSTLLIHEPIVAKVLSATIATFGTWLGNRYWTFRDRRRSARLKEMFEFGLVAVGGISISVVCLGISRYVLGFTSLLADNIATNVVGFVLATLFRFLMYRHWVFGRNRQHHSKSNNTISAAALATLDHTAKESD